MRWILIATVLTTAAGICWAEDVKPAEKPKDPAPGFEKPQYWVFTFSNFLRDDTTAKKIALAQRAAKAGYNGIVVSDVKFSKFHLQPPKFAANVARFRQACSAAKMKVLAGVCPMGYCDMLLTHDVDLAEGMPVVNQPFVVKGGKLVALDDIDFVNGSFETFKGDRPAGWEVDVPGTLSFIDAKERTDGKVSLRQQDPGTGDEHKRGRVYQRLKVKRFQYYHASVMVKTDKWLSRDIRMGALFANGRQWCNWQPPPVKPDMPWTRIHTTFNTLDNDTVTFYFGCWNGKTGKLWLDDFRLAPAGFVNVIRRDSCPLTVVSEDGKTTYVEGKDFSEVRDPKFGHDPNPGYFTTWHDVPPVAIPAGSRLTEGRKVLVSYHHAMIGSKAHQIMVCMAEPKLYDVIEKQIKWVKANVQPDAYFMGHDEIRHQGWDASCVKTGKTPGQVLADNARRCVQIIKKVDPGKPIVVWSDMFDPHHNAAKTDRNGRPFHMYMVKGPGPWYGSWEGLTRDVVIANWRNNRREDVDFFEARGQQQVLCGYYDRDPKRIVDWLKMARGAKGVVGVMYTTWRGDYTKIEQFIGHVKGYERSAKNAPAASSE